MGRLWLWLKAFLADSWEEFCKSSLYTQMWVEGYTEDEIDEEMRRFFPEEKG